ncbi:hypothetical protein ACIPW5_25515 [Streptomyces sp. NPDC090077]|uniref:hypothetical protein n=1 Tax=Streptomyces sp. NPDC090077 TaxID=3365938 RepID=UPI0038171AD2
MVGAAALPAHRADRRTDNPHAIVTKITRSGRASASTAYVSHLLDPKLVAAALGMDPEGVMTYLADHVDAGRLPDA